jgi:predicted Zn-dependent protease
MNAKIFTTIIACALLAATPLNAQDKKDTSPASEITVEQLQRLGAQLEANPLVDKTDMRIEKIQPTEAHKKRSDSLRRYARLAYLMQAQRYDDLKEAFASIDSPRDEWPLPLRILELRYLVDSSQIDVAYERASNIIKLHPESIEPYILMSEVEVQRKEFDSAIEWLEKARKIAPRNQQVLQMLGRRYEFAMQTARNNDDFAQALNKMEEVYDDLVETLPGRRGARYLRLLAYLAEKNNHMDKALEYMRRLVRVMPYEVEFAVKLAQLEMDQGNLDEAREVLRRALSRQPDDMKLREAIIDYFRKPGVVPEGQDRAEAMIEFYRDLAKQYPGRDALQIELARMLIGASKEEEALKILNDSLNFHPENQETRILLADIYGTLDKKEKALELIEEFIKRSGEDTISMRTALVTLIKHDYNDEAENVLKDIISSDPKLWNMRVMLADLYARSGKTSEIAPLLKDTASDFSENPDVLFEVAMRAWSNSSEDYALDLLRQVINLEPDHAEAHNSLGYFMTERGKNLDEALRLIKRAMELNPGQGHIMDSLGWVYYKKGLFEKAIQTLEDANKLLQPDSESIGHLAWAYLAAGRKTEALANFKKAIELLEQKETTPEVIKEIEILQDEVDKLNKNRSNQ